MPLQSWLCEQCKQPYSTEAEASACEIRHVKAYEIQITEVEYQPGDSLPMTIIVEISKGSVARARYRKWNL